MTMPVAEIYMTCLVGAKNRQPFQQREIMKLENFFSCAVGCGGDMNPELAQSLLDDLSAEGKNIFAQDSGFRYQDFQTYAGSWFGYPCRDAESLEWLVIIKNSYIYVSDYGAVQAAARQARC